MHNIEFVGFLLFGLVAVTLLGLTGVFIALRRTIRDRLHLFSVRSEAMALWANFGRLVDDEKQRNEPYVYKEVQYAEVSRLLLHFARRVRRDVQLEEVGRVVGLLFEVCQKRDAFTSELHKIPAYGAATSQVGAFRMQTYNARRQRLQADLTDLGNEEALRMIELNEIVRADIKPLINHFRLLPKHIYSDEVG